MTQITMICFLVVSGWLSLLMWKVIKLEGKVNED